MRTGQGRKIPVILHRQPPAPPAFNSRSLLNPSQVKRAARALWVSSDPRRWQIGSGTPWLKWAGGSRWPLLCHHSSAVTKHMFFLCLQPGASRTCEAWACITKSEDFLCPTSPNEGVVEMTRTNSTRECYGNLQNWGWRLWHSVYRHFVIRSVLCMGKSLDGSFLHLWITNTSNLSTLAGLESKVGGISLSNLSSGGISTSIYLKVIAQLPSIPSPFLFIFYQFSKSAIILLTYLLMYLLSIFPTRVSALWRLEYYFFCTFLYPQSLG